MLSPKCSVLSAECCQKNRIPGKVIGARMKQADAFNAFEHGACENVVRPYDDFFGKLTTQCMEPLLDAVGATRGTRLLQA